MKGEVVTGLSVGQDRPEPLRVEGRGREAEETGSGLETVAEVLALARRGDGPQRLEGGGKMAGRG